MAGIAKENVVFFCPIPTTQTVTLGFKKGSYALTNLGLERRCSMCAEFWPADTEFFWSTPKSPSGLHCWCKACYTERRSVARQAA